MNASTGLVITAGALVLGADLVTGKFEPVLALKTTVATVLAAFVGAGLDKVLPGFGTGLGVLLVLSVVYKRGPELSNNILKG